MPDRTRVLLIAAVVLAFDQITKLMVNAWIPFQTRIPLIDGFFGLTHIHNTGAAFGLFSDAPATPVRIALIVVSIFAVGLIWAYARQGWHDARVVAASGLILGGAVGNLVDRLRLTYVIDFIDVHWGRYQWPFFNIADSAITLGAITLFIVMARQGDVEESSPASTKTAGEGFSSLPAHDTPAKEPAAEDAAGVS